MHLIAWLILLMRELISSVIRSGVGQLYVEIQINLSKKSQLAINYALEMFMKVVYVEILAHMLIPFGLMRRPVNEKIPLRI